MWLIKLTANSRNSNRKMSHKLLVAQSPAYIFLFDGVLGHDLDGTFSSFRSDLSRKTSIFAPSKVASRVTTFPTFGTANRAQLNVCEFCFYKQFCLFDFSYFSFVFSAVRNCVNKLLWRDRQCFCLISSSFLSHKNIEQLYCCLSLKSYYFIVEINKHI